MFHCRSHAHNERKSTWPAHQLFITSSNPSKVISAALMVVMLQANLLEGAAVRLETMHLISLAAICVACAYSILINMVCRVAITSYLRLYSTTISLMTSSVLLSATSGTTSKALMVPLPWQSTYRPTVLSV